MQKLSKSKQQIVSHLSSRKMRQKYGCFSVEGIKSISDIVDYEASVFEILYLITTPHTVDKAHRIIERYVIKNPQFSAPEIYEATTPEMKNMSSLSTPAEMIAICRLPERRSESDILASPLSEDLYLMLDGVQDPGNLGTIIRTAHWMGIKKIFASPDTVDVFNPKVIQSTMGSLGAVDVEYVNLRDVIRRYPKIPVAGLLLEGENIYNAELPSSAFIVMGNEGNGISQPMREMLTNSYTIPPYSLNNHSESLNVAVATAITLSEFRRKSLNLRHL